MQNRSYFIPIIVGAVVASVSVVALILTTKFVGPLPLAVNQTVTQKQSTFDVQGESEVVTIPDVAEVSLGIEIRKASIAEAQTEANTVINSVKDRVKTLGVQDQDIKTQNYSVFPEYDFSDSSRRVIGYRVSTSLRVNVKDFEVINQIIDQATQAGANQVSGINLTLSPEKEEEVKKQAREEAIAKAKENATELSNLAGMKLGRIVNVYEQPVYGGPIYQDRISSALSEATEARGGGTEIEPGSTTYTYSVTLSYETF